MSEGVDSIRVVLVDDHQMFTESLARVLARDPGIDVVGIAATGAKGAWLTGAERPDVVILDYHLPDVDAPTLAGILRAESPTTRIVVLTGSTDERALLAALEAGCVGFVTKDRAVDELVIAVRQVHSGDAYVPSSMVATLLTRAGRDGIGSTLTDREREVLEQVADGLTNAAVAEALYLSVHTVRSHVQNILMKLGAHSKLEAVAIATREGLLRSSR